METSRKVIPQEFRTLGWTALVFFVIALIISHNAINAALWGIFGAYLWAGMFCNDEQLKVLVDSNLYASLIMIILSAINMRYGFVSMPHFISNTDILSMFIIICVFSVIGLIILPISEASAKAEEYLMEFENQ